MFWSNSPPQARRSIPDNPYQGCLIPQIGNRRQDPAAPRYLAPIVFVRGKNVPSSKSDRRRSRNCCTSLRNSYFEIVASTSIELPTPITYNYPLMFGRFRSRPFVPARISFIPFHSSVKIYGRRYQKMHFVTDPTTQSNCELICYNASGTVITFRPPIRLGGHHETCPFRLGHFLGIADVLWLRHAYSGFKNGKSS